MRFFRAVLGALLGTAWLLAVPWSASGQGEEEIFRFYAEVEIRNDGALEVTEEIGYDFGSNDRHGIVREIDVRTPVDRDTDRVYRLDLLSVLSTTGAPDDVDIQSGATTTIIRIGDPGRTVNGRHIYLLRYVLNGHLNAFDDHDELFWQATGNRWTVPMAGVLVTVRAPAGVQQVRCLAGRPASTAACDDARLASAQEATFSQDRLRPGEGLTVVVGLAKNTVTVPPPEFAERNVPLLQRLPLWVPFGAAGLLVLATAAGSAMAWSRFGRDRRYAAMPLGLTPAPGQPAAEEYVAIMNEPEPAVAFIPPKGVQPALAGVLTAERTLPTHVSATIVDLAVRGYLRIEELDVGNGRPRDWRLVRRDRPSPGDELAPYEKELVQSLFVGQPAVQLSNVRGQFATSLRQIRVGLADEAYRRGWFRRRPPVTGIVSLRTIGWITLAVVAVVSFSELSSAAAAIGPPGLVLAAGVAIAAVIVAFTVRALPARTALGRAVWAQVQGFRRYLATAEADQLRDDEAANNFTRYLPYAIIFGLTDRWARVLADLQRPVEIDWYFGPGVGNMYSLGNAMTDFSSTSTSALSYDPSSSASGGSGFSSSGSSGGGSGGGGGGSW